jgi:predicted dehydrogenase
MAILTSGFVPDAEGRWPAIVRQPFFATLDRLLLMEVMIHHVDTLRFLLGPLRLESAVLGRSCPGVRGEDRATLSMSSPAGAAGESQPRTVLRRPRNRAGVQARRCAGRRAQW